jgi:hypothetical protein
MPPLATRVISLDTCQDEARGRSLLQMSSALSCFKSLLVILIAAIHNHCADGSKSEFSSKSENHFQS